MQKAMITIVLLAILSVVQSTLILSPANAEQNGITLRAYGPGGPAPAMRDAAKAFGEKKGIKVEINAGPASKWKDQALKDADMIFSGAEFMMTDFAQKALPGLIDTSTIRTLYLRPSAILVRPGNPKSIKGVKDLTRPGLKILVVQGAGQVGMWEDVAGRTGDAKLVDSIRRNIAFFAPNSAEAKNIWSRDPSVVDAWLIWNIWQKANPTAADLVDTEPENTIYRSCGIAVTNRSPHKALVKEFVDFLTSDQGKDIFSKRGWRVR